MITRKESLQKPNSFSSLTPEIKRLNILISKWITPACRNMQVMNRHASPPSNTLSRSRAPNNFSLHKLKTTPEKPINHHSLHVYLELKWKHHIPIEDLLNFELKWKHHIPTNIFEQEKHRIKPIIVIKVKISWFNYCQSSVELAKPNCYHGRNHSIFSVWICTRTFGRFKVEFSQD